MSVRLAPRRGAVTLEYAVVVPLFFFLVLAMVVGGLGVFQSNQIGWLTWEAARWAAVHGGQYAQDTGQPAASPSDVYNNVILPQSSLLDPSKLTYSVTWDDPGEMPTYLDSNNNPQTNRVHVTISYQWLPTMLLGGMTLSSTAEMELYN